jgi:hypothetical protein
MNTESPYTAQDRQHWRQLLLAKGQEVAKKLEDVLAGKDVKLSEIELRQVDKVKEPREKQLRRFLDLLMGRLRKVDDPRFGFDPEKGSFVPKAALDEVPWLELDP